MPELSFQYQERGHHRSAEAISSLYLRGIMLFPEAEEGAQAFVHSAFKFGCADYLLDPSTGERSTITELLKAADDAETFERQCAEASNYAVRSANGKQGLHGGMIAGFVLLIPLVVAAKTKRMVGRKAAFRVLQAWLSKEHRMIGAKERNLIKLWQRYQSVAHFWAAHLTLCDLPADGRGLVHFVAMAEFMRTCAEAHMPERAREPLLDAKVTWKLPASVTIEPVAYDFSWPDLPQSWLDRALDGSAD